MDLDTLLTAVEREGRTLLAVADRNAWKASLQGDVEDVLTCP